MDNIKRALVKAGLTTLGIILFFSTLAGIIALFILLHESFGLYGVVAEILVIVFICLFLLFLEEQ